MPSEIRFTTSGSVDDLMDKFAGSAVAPEPCFINRTSMVLQCGCSVPPSWFAVKAVRRKRAAIVNRLCVSAASASLRRCLAAEIQGFRKGSPLDIGCKERSARRFASASLTASIADRQENAGRGYRDHREKKFSLEKTTQLESRSARVSLSRGQMLLADDYTRPRAGKLQQSR
jgi:hypothetical protein